MARKIKLTKDKSKLLIGVAFKLYQADCFIMEVLKDEKVKKKHIKDIPILDAALTLKATIQMVDSEFYNQIKELEPKKIFSEIIKYLTNEKIIEGEKTIKLKKV